MPVTVAARSDVHMEDHSGVKRQNGTTITAYDHVRTLIWEGNSWATSSPG
ncbi:hypothetical protein GCM10009780_07770 [Actinomadura alba]